MPDFIFVRTMWIEERACPTALHPVSAGMLQRGNFRSGAERVGERSPRPGTDGCACTLLFGASSCRVESWGRNLALPGELPEGAFAPGCCQSPVLLQLQGGPGTLRSPSRCRGAALSWIQPCAPLRGAPGAGVCRRDLQGESWTPGGGGGDHPPAAASCPQHLV